MSDESCEWLAGSQNMTDASLTWSAPQNTLLGAPYGQGGAERPLDQLLKPLFQIPDYRSYNCATQADCFTSLSPFPPKNRDNNTPSGCWQDYTDNRQALLGWYLAHRRYLLTVRQTGYLDEQDKHVTF